MQASLAAGQQQGEKYLKKVILVLLERSVTEEQNGPHEEICVHKPVRSPHCKSF